MAAENGAPTLAKIVDAAIVRAIADAVAKRHQQRAQTPDAPKAEPSHDAAA